MNKPGMHPLGGAENGEIEVLRRIVLWGLVLFLMTGPVPASWSAQKESPRIQDMVDLVVLRPLGCVATVGGACFFVVTLPFTVPTHSAKKSAEAFVAKPFRYTFARPFPDENL